MITFIEETNVYRCRVKVLDMFALWCSVHQGSVAKYFLTSAPAFLGLTDKYYNSSSDQKPSETCGSGNPAVN